MKQKLKNLMKKLAKNQKLWEKIVGIVFFAEFSLVFLVWSQVGSDSFAIPIILILIVCQLLILPVDDSKRND